MVEFFIVMSGEGVKGQTKTYSEILKRKAKCHLFRKVKGTSENFPSGQR
jgi:hypothetical protein